MGIYAIHLINIHFNDDVWEVQQIQNPPLAKKLQQ